MIYEDIHHISGVQSSMMTADAVRHQRGHMNANLLCFPGTRDTGDGKDEHNRGGGRSTQVIGYQLTMQTSCCLRCMF